MEYTVPYVKGNFSPVLGSNLRGDSQGPTPFGLAYLNYTREGRRENRFYE